MTSKMNASKVEKQEPLKKVTASEKVIKYTRAWLDGPISLPKNEVGTMTVPTRSKNKKAADAKKEYKVVAPDKNSQESIDLKLRTMTGTYTVDETTWRILGMIPGTYTVYENIRRSRLRKAPEFYRPKREDAIKLSDDPISSDAPKPSDETSLIADFSVLQIPQVYKLAGKSVKETMTKSKNEHILRICFSDKETYHGHFRQEKELMKILRKKYCHNKRFYDHFPRVLGEGELAKLKFFENRDRNAETYSVYEPSIPKPFFIMEKIGPTLEEFRVCQRLPDKITPYATIFLIIGCLRVLRLCHDAGIAVCDVRPSHFSLRLGPSGMLHRRESDAIGLVVLTHFSSACAYRTQRYISQANLIGTKKYASPEVMTSLPPGPVDDVLSCMYMLYEFLTGQLPWIPKNDKKLYTVLRNREIIKEKKNLESIDEIPDINSATKEGPKPKPIFLHLNQVFSEIRKANGYDVPINYEDVSRILLAGIIHREDIDRGRSTFSFQHPAMYAYRHGIEDKEGADKKGTVPLFPEDATTGETDDIRVKANWLFSYARDKRKDEAAKASSKHQK